MYEGLQTPAAVIDLDIMEANISAMAARLKARGIGHRPHIKAHKSVAIARAQMRAGASGITVAKLSEAEVFAAAGIGPILVAYSLVGDDKLKRLADLHAKADLLVTVDSLECARGLSAVGAAAGKPLRALVEIDGGLHRGGVGAGRAATDFALSLRGLPGLEVVGIMGYFGLVYDRRDPEDFSSAIREESRAMSETARLFREAGIKADIVSSGTSPAALLCDCLDGITEVRAGNYVFFDVSSVAAGLVREEDCALRVIATVVSCPLPGYATIDAGTKTMTSDGAHNRGGFGIVVGHPGVTVAGLNEEHGLLRFDPEKERLKIGDRVEIIPNHACVIPNLNDRVAGVRKGAFAEWIDVDARGRNY
jgi:D-serine deaminase-like pyridoxal phosphate-dependent protein